MDTKLPYLVELPNGLSFSTLECIYDVGRVSEEYERNAKSIWVITKNLSLDLEDSAIKQAVIENFDKNKYYTYILPESSRGREYGMRYNSVYGAYKGKYNFVYIPEETFDFFEELVIYDKKIGFVLLTLENKKSIYIKIARKLIIEYVSKLSRYFDDFTKIKDIALEFLNYPEIRDNELLKDHFYSLYQTPVIVKTDEELEGFLEFLNRNGLDGSLIKYFRQKIESTGYTYIRERKKSDED